MYKHAINNYKKGEPIKLEDLRKGNRIKVEKKEYLISKILKITDNPADSNELFFDVVLLPVTPNNIRNLEIFKDDRKQS